MGTDLVQLFMDYSVNSATEGHKHHREGWINVQCPFCSGDPGYHLGFNLLNNYSVCWRCGFQGTQKAIAGVLGVSYKKAKEILKEYNQGVSTNHNTKAKIKTQKKAFRTPKPLIPIKENTPGFWYLRKRGFSVFDIDKLQDDFGVQQTGPVCSFVMNNKPVNLKFRIFAPIYYQDAMVSWQTRDISGNAGLKYLTCPGNVEKINHKKLIYFYKGMYKFALPDYIVLTEGIFDVWKIHLAGFFSGCGFGVELTIDQIYFLKHHFKRILFFLDPDRAGSRKGKELFSQLSFAGVQCELVQNNTDKDPGDMYTKDIRYCLQKHFNKK